MSASTYVDTKDFNKALKKWLSLSSRSNELAINTKMFHLLRRAQNETPKGNPAKIAQELGQEGTKVRRVRKTGELKAGQAIVKGGSLIYRIVNARRRKAGEPGLTGKEMGRAARKVLKARQKSTGTLKAGWNVAKVKFARSAKSYGGGGKGPRVKARSQAFPAKNKPNPVAKAVYKLISREGRGSKGIHPIVRKALNRAWSAEYREIVNHINSKLKGATGEVQRGAR
tara:strand:+ start:2770 stop:3450 length:681 start_codon:yes stop_codon:yes gene_type:complete